MKVAGFELFDYQQAALDDIAAMPAPIRVCLFYKTGAGKSLTALAALSTLGYDEAVVIAPPSTHQQWIDLGVKLDVVVYPMSHAKFRMKDTRMSRTMPVVADEMHLFGGQRGKGWRKLDTLAQHLQAPLILASATPNYNDAERCYCVQHVLDPDSCSGGFLQFLYQNCVTEQDPFSMVPKVLGFRKHAGAAQYLADLPGVLYLPDDLVYEIEDREYPEDIPADLAVYGYDRRRHRMVASIMEMRHTTRYQGLVNEEGYLHPTVLDEVVQACNRLPVLIFANHATVAEAISRSLDRYAIPHRLVTGADTLSAKERALNEFRTGRNNVLVGTATLATGTDGLDRVCDRLLIVDDTDDDALRRQLIGRIMPRGLAVDASGKEVIRLVPEDF